MGKRNPQQFSEDCKLDHKIKPHNHQEVKVLSETQLRCEWLFNYLWMLDWAFLDDIVSNIVPAEAAVFIQVFIQAL